MANYSRGSQIEDLAHGLYFGVSAMKLVNNGNINLCTIREDDGDTTNTFQMSQGASHLNTTAVDTFIGTNNGLYTERYDQVNNARKLIQATTSNQPRYVEEAINGKVGFDSDVPATVNKSLKLSAGLAKSTAATFFAVADKEPAQGSGASCFGNNDGLVADTFFVTFAGTGVVSLRIRDSAGSADDTGNVAIDDGKHLFRVVCDGVDRIDLYVDNVSKGGKTVAGGFLNTIDQPQNGAFGGLFSDFLIWDRILTSAEITRVEAYINNIYNI